MYLHPRILKLLFFFQEQSLVNLDKVLNRISMILGRNHLLSETLTGFFFFLIIFYIFKRIYNCIYQSRYYVKQMQIKSNNYFLQEIFNVKWTCASDLEYSFKFMNDWKINKLIHLKVWKTRKNFINVNLLNLKFDIELNEQVFERRSFLESF